MKSKWCSISILIIVLQLFFVIPAFASDIGINKEQVKQKGIKTSQEFVSVGDNNITYTVDTYVYKTDMQSLRNGDVVNKYSIVQEILRANSSEDFPYYDQTLSIYGTMTVTMNHSGIYKKITKVANQWHSDDNQVVVTQQDLEVIQNGIAQDGSHFIDYKTQSFGSSSSWNYSTPSSWPLCEDADAAVFFVGLTVTVKDLWSGDTWTTGAKMQ